MKTLVEVDIFPNPNKCGTNDENHCEYMHSDCHRACWCRQFGPDLINFNEEDMPDKCDQCKEVYNRKTPYIDPIKWFPKTMKSAEEFLKSIAHEMDEKERKAFIFGWQSSIRFQEDNQ